MKILDRRQCTEAYCNAIKGAKDFLVISSPYFDEHNKYDLKIIHAQNVLILYREKKGYPDFNKRYFTKLQKEVEFLKEGKISIQLLGIPNLHTKCVINEKFAVMSSMNMTDHSIHNNYEMGMQVWSNINQDDATKEKNAEDIRRYNEICLCVASIYNKKAEEKWEEYNDICPENRQFNKFFFDDNPIKEFLFPCKEDIIKFNNETYLKLAFYLEDVLQLYPDINESCEYLEYLFERLDWINDQIRFYFDECIMKIISDVSNQILETEEHISISSIKKFMTTAQKLIVNYYESNYINQKDYVAEQIEKKIKTKN